MMTGIYYDGKSSKQYRVEVNTIGNYLNINSLDGSLNRIVKWKIEDVKSENFSSQSKIMLTYGDKFPYQKLELIGPHAEEVLTKVLANEGNIKRIEHGITKSNPFKIVVLSLISIVIIVAGYVMYVSPFIGEQTVKILPKSIEEKAGKAIYDNMSFFVDKDSLKSELLLEFYKECGFKSEYDIRIDYIEDDLVNAFALPGGQLVVYEGIINKLDSWEELAALLGHELAHVNQQHSFKQIARNLSSFYIISVITGDVAGVSAIILEQASQINQLSNSRKYEEEADIIGLSYLKEAKLEPDAMVSLFQMIDGETSSKIMDKLEYLSTHPLSKNRINYIESLIETDDSYQYTPREISRAEEIFNQLKVDVIEEKE